MWEVENIKKALVILPFIILVSCTSKPSSELIEDAITKKFSFAQIKSMDVKEVSRKLDTTFGQNVESITYQGRVVISVKETCYWPSKDPIQKESKDFVTCYSERTAGFNELIRRNENLRNKKYPVAIGEEFILTEIKILCSVNKNEKPSKWNCVKA